MAADWIKMRVDLASDPAVISIAEKTGLDEDTVVGKLHRLWGWADQQTTNGNAVGVTKNWIDRFLRAENFANSMEEAGWLTVKNDGVRFPRFDRHNLKSGKQRALTAKRVAKFKAQKGNANGNGVSVSSALPTEEKNISIKSPLPPFDQLLDSAALQEALTTWVEYKAEGGFRYKPRGLKSLVTRIKSRAEVHGEQAVVDAIVRASSQGYKGWDFDEYFDGKAEAESLVATAADLEGYDLMSGARR